MFSKHQTSKSNFGNGKTGDGKPRWHEFTQDGTPCTKSQMAKDVARKQRTRSERTWFGKGRCSNLQDQWNYTYKFKFNCQGEWLFVILLWWKIPKDMFNLGFKTEIDHRWLHDVYFTFQQRLVQHICFHMILLIMQSCDNSLEYGL